MVGEDCADYNAMYSSIDDDLQFFSGGIGAWHTAALARQANASDNKYFFGVLISEGQPYVTYYPRQTWQKDKSSALVAASFLLDIYEARCGCINAALTACARNARPEGAWDAAPAGRFRLQPPQPHQARLCWG